MVHSGCTITCKEGGTLNVSPKQQTHNHASTKSRYGGRGPENSPATSMEFGRKHAKERESPKQQKAALQGWPFSDTAVTVPIKKRKIQMLEVVCSPSPRSSSLSPAKVAHFSSPTINISLDSEQDVLRMSPLEPSVVGDLHSFRKSNSFRGSIEGDSSSESWQPELELAIIGPSETVTLENQDMTDLKLVDEMQLPKGEGENINRHFDRNVIQSSDLKGNSMPVFALKLDLPIQGEDVLNTGGCQKMEFTVNDARDREVTLLRLGTQKSVQDAESSVKGACDKEGPLLKLNSFCDHDDRLCWDLNMEMEAWEQTESEQLPTDNLGDAKVKASESNLSFKRKDNGESILDVIFKNNVGIDCHGLFGEGDDIGPAFIAESFEYDAYDGEEELIPTIFKKHLMESGEADLVRNRHHQALVVSVRNEAEAEEYVNFSDSDCRDSDDISSEDEKRSLVLEAENDFNSKELHKVQMVNKQFTLEEKLDINDPNFHIPRESHGTPSTEMKEDGELSHLEEDSRELLESAESEESMQEFESKRIVQVDESNIGSKDVSGKSELWHEVDNQQTPTSESRLQKQSASCRKKFRDWDDGTKGADSLQAALRAAEESLMARQSFLSDKENPSTSVSKPHSFCVDGARRNHYMTRGRETYNSYYHKRSEEGINYCPRPLPLREALHARKYGRGSWPGRVRVEPWMNGPGSKWRPNYYNAHSVGRTSRAPLNAAALAMAKVRSNGFIVASDGTLIRARTAASAGRGDMQAFRVSERHERVMNARRSFVDDDTRMGFCRMNKPFHHSIGSVSKPTRKSLSPARYKGPNNRSEEHRSHGKGSKSVLLEVHSPKRGSSPVFHGSAVVVSSQVLSSAQQISPTRGMQSEQIGEQECSSLERSRHDNSDTRKFKMVDDDTASFSDSYHSGSPMQG